MINTDAAAAAAAVVAATATAIAIATHITSSQPRPRAITHLVPCLQTTIHTVEALLSFHTRLIMALLLLPTPDTKPARDLLWTSPGTMPVASLLPLLIIRALTLELLLLHQKLIPFRHSTSREGDQDLTPPQNVQTSQPLLGKTKAQSVTRCMPKRSAYQGAQVSKSKRFPMSLHIINTTRFAF